MNKFQQVYERLTSGRRDMKNFHEMLHFLNSTEERYHKDLEAGLKKQSAPILNTTLTAMYIDVKQTVVSASKFHQMTLAATYKDLESQLDTIIKEVKSTKTKLLDSYTKLCREVDQKKAAHTKAKKTYEDSVDKAEMAVANFRSGRSQVGNDKQVKKLEEAMHSASKELEKNHSAYLKAVRDCQNVQEKFEVEVEQLLSQFEDLEKKRLATYQAVMNRYVDVQQQLLSEVTTSYELLSATSKNVNPLSDILNFIIDTYDGKPLDSHAFYEPKNSEVIPHYGDVGGIQESREHLAKTQANHVRLMKNSSYQVAQYNLQSGSTTSPGGPVNSPSFVVDNDTQVTSFASPTATVAPVVTQPAQVPPAQPNNAVGQFRCTALYEFTGEEPGDLPFRVNQVIELVECNPEEDWWVGRVDGIQGAFPKSYVSPPVEINDFSPPAAQPPPQQQAAIPAEAAPVEAAPAAMDEGALFQVRAQFDFDGQEADELSLRVGDVLTVYSQIEDWYEGVNSAGSRGIFPANHVQRI